MALVQMSVVDQLPRRLGAPNRWGATSSSSDCTAAIILLDGQTVFTELSLDVWLTLETT
jgi:hypothetical protein